MAAGQGFKTFTTGEVLSASDVNGYLMQGVLVFASAAARDAAITSPQEGQFAYLKDTNVTTYYTGSAWANLDTTGMTNPMTTTGDTIYSSSGSTPARLGIGSTGQVLTVSGGVPTWATASSGSMTELASGSMSGTKVSLNSISSGYKNLVLIVRDFYSSANAYMGLTVNNTTGIYAFTASTSGDNPMTTTYQNRQVEYLNSQTDNFLIVTYFDYASSGSYKTAYEQSIYGHLYNANQWNLTTAGDFIRTTSAISSIEMNSTSGSFSAGNYVLYGVK